MLVYQKLVKSEIKSGKVVYLATPRDRPMNDRVKDDARKNLITLPHQKILSKAYTAKFKVMLGIGLERRHIFKVLNTFVVYDQSRIRDINIKSINSFRFVIFLYSSFF